MRSRTNWTKTLVNLEKGTILSRTPYRWLLLIGFYIVFFCGIISLWLFCYWVFEKTLTSERPKWLIYQPGFSFEPATTFGENYLKIEYREQSLAKVQHYVNHINKTLKNYDKIPDNYFGIECQAGNDYGYKNRKPCFFLKINRIIGFKTQAMESLMDLPRETPQDLYEYLIILTKEERKQRIWVSCESKPSLKFLYYPQRFFNVSDVDQDSIATFNNTNDIYTLKDFKRIIAVQIANISLNIKYHIRCMLWAKNIIRDYEGKTGRGLVRFSFEIKT